MKKVFIKMNNLTDIKNFLAKAMQVEGDVLVKKGQYVVDGKSVMGVFTLDVSTGVTIEYPATAADFDEFITQFICKENQLKENK
jgi:phosphotransferase system HPr-like phosphotransfer protein